MLATLAELGISAASSIYREHLTAGGEGPLAGLTFVLTGALSRPRPEFEQLIAEAGGRAPGSVAKRTNDLVAGEGGGTEREKAVALGSHIIGEAELMRLLEGESI